MSIRKQAAHTIIKRMRSPVPGKKEPRSMYVKLNTAAYQQKISKPYFGLFIISEGRAQNLS